MHIVAATQTVAGAEPASAESAAAAAASTPTAVETTATTEAAASAIAPGQFWSADLPLTFSRDLEIRIFTSLDIGARTHLPCYCSLELV